MQDRLYSAGCIVASVLKLRLVRKPNVCAELVPRRDQWLGQKKFRCLAIGRRLGDTLTLPLRLDYDRERDHELIIGLRERSQGVDGWPLCGSAS